MSFDLGQQPNEDRLRYVKAVNRARMRELERRLHFHLLFVPRGWLAGVKHYPLPAEPKIVMKCP